MTEGSVIRLLKRIEGSYLLKTPPAAVSAWVEALQGVDDDTGHNALTRHVRDVDRAPKPSDIIRLASSIQTGRLPVETIPQRLARLNAWAARQVRERLDRHDEDELRFQRFMLAKHVLEGGLTPDMRAYFLRILGREAVAEVEADTKHDGRERTCSCCAPR